MFVRTALLVLRKDVAVELKSREVLSTAILFAVSCVMVFSIAFVREGAPLAGAASGILWVAIAFSGTLALGRTFERERYGDTLRALLLAPAPRAAIYVGKLLGLVALMLGTEALLVPMIAFLFQAPLFTRPLLLGALLLLGTVGFASVGTLFAAMLVRTRTRDVMLPILLYPITIPVMIAGVLGTAALTPTPDAPVNEALATMWLGVLAAVDVVFLTLALWTFEPLMTE
jgi:heme exporter protein CcmB